MGKPYNLIRNKYKTSVKKKLTKKQRTESIKNYHNKKKPAGPFRTENMFEKIDSTTAKTSTTNKEKKTTQN